MLEIGVDTANSTERLLDIYSPHELELHVGIDPYFNKKSLGVDENGIGNGDRTHLQVQKKLKRFGTRSRLIRETSLEAAKQFEDGTFDLIFVDAMHDFFSVTEDILAWIRKINRRRVPYGGAPSREHTIICGHDFQWQYPGLPMAISTVARRMKLPVHLASDGMWWLELKTFD